MDAVMALQAAHGSRKKEYQSTAADLRVEIDGITKTMKAIVDSDATWCAVDAKYLSKHFPDVKITPVKKVFRDASRNIMPLLGFTRLHFYIGDLKLETEAYVFERLGAPFLLGVNAMRYHDLGISNRRQRIYSEADDATSQSHEALKTQPGCDVLHVSQECKCHCDEGGCHLECNLDQSRLTATIESEVRAEQGTYKTDGAQLNLPPPAPRVTKTSTLILPRKVVIPAHSKPKLYRLDYASPFATATGTVVQVEVLESFKKKFGMLGLTMSEAMQHSSSNKHAAILLGNPTPTDVHVPRTDVATAVLTPDHGLSASAPPAMDELPAEILTGLRLRVQMDRRASPSTWKGLGPTAPSSMV